MTIERIEEAAWEMTLIERIDEAIERADYEEYNRLMNEYESSEGYVKPSGPSAPSAPSTSSSLIERIEEAAERDDYEEFYRLMNEYESSAEESNILGSLGSALKETLIDESLFPAVRAVGSTFDKGVEYLPRPVSNLIKGFQRGIGDNVEGLSQAIYYNDPEALMNIYRYRDEALTEYQKNVDSDKRIPYSGIGRFGGNIAPFMANPTSLPGTVLAGGLSGLTLPTDNYDNILEDKLTNAFIGSTASGLLRLSGPLIERSVDSSISGLKKTVQSVQDGTQARARLANTVESISDRIPVIGKKSDTSMRKARKAIKEEFLDEDFLSNRVLSRSHLDAPELNRRPLQEDLISFTERKISDAINAKELTKRELTERELIKNEILKKYIKENPKDVLKIQKDILVERGAKTGSESLKDIGKDLAKDLARDIPSMAVFGAPIKTVTNVIDKGFRTSKGVNDARIEQKLIDNMEDFLFPTSRALRDVVAGDGLTDVAIEAAIDPGSALLKYSRFAGDAADMGLGSGRFSQIYGPTDNPVEWDEDGNIMFRQLYGD